jgi:AcrR family transcriptional regulator
VATPEPISADKQSGPRSPKGVATRARLVAAAKEVFEEDGFLDARISDIAERAGLSHGSFYHYFESKEEVFREVVAAVEQTLSEPMDSIILNPDSILSPLERITGGIRVHMESYRREARIMAVIELMARYDPHTRQVRSERKQHNAERLTVAIQLLQTHGMADPDLEPHVAAAVLGAMTTRFPELWLVEGGLDVDFDRGVEQLTRIFTNALGLKESVAKPRLRRNGARPARA